MNKESISAINRGKIILDLCGGTGAWSKPYRDEKYPVFVITLPKYDLLKTEFTDIHIVFWEPDGIHSLAILKSKVYGILAAPTCTMFSRARTTAKTPRDFRGAMDLVDIILKIIWECEFSSHFTLKFWALENPAGHLSLFLGNPPFSFHPYDFGDRHSKQTYIWGKFNKPKKNSVTLNEEELLQSRNNTRPLPKIPEGYISDGKMKSVQIRRSITPEGFAKAFYKVNK